MSASSTRIARLEKVGEVMEDELVKSVLEKMGNLTERATNIEKNMLRKDLVQIKDLFKSIERGYDLAFSAGVLTEEGSSVPIEESIKYAQGAAPETRYIRLGRATQCLTKVLNKIEVFLNTACDVNNPCERMVDSSGNMEGEASILHAWLCNSSSSDEGDTDIEEFVEEVIQWIRMAYERISSSSKLAYAAYGARPKSVNMSSHSLNHDTANNTIRKLGEDEMSVKTGLDRNASWVQEVNREKQNWSRPEKIMGKTVTFEEGEVSKHPETTNTRPSEQPPNVQNVTALSSYFGNNEQSKGVSDLVSGKLKETKMVVQNQVQLKQNHTLSEARK